MKIIQSGLKYIAILGVRPNKSLINVKFFVAVVANVTNVAQNFLFLIREANTFIEYANSIFLISTVTMTVVSFTIAVMVRSYAFEFMNLAEKQIDESE